jgi:hypothetical protein
VINLKWSVFAGGFGFTASLLVGIFSGAGFPFALLRAGIFGAAFFGLAGLAWFLINNFIPELLYTGAGDEDSREPPGSRVDISVEDGQESALPELPRASGEDEVDNISDLASGKTPPPRATGMDQMREDGYTETSGVDLQTETPAASNGASPGEDYGLGDALPDLDSMTGAFVQGGEEAALVEAEAETSLSGRRPIGNKNQSLQGDFDPKELAAAIRTTLNKE